MDEMQIASPEEVLAAFTRLLRGEKGSEQLKAAEQLGKYYGLFAAREPQDAVDPLIVAEVERAVADAAELREILNS